MRAEFNFVGVPVAEGWGGEIGPDPLPAPSKPISPLAALLMRGREKVARGWCQGQLWDGDNVCAVGGLFYPGEALTDVFLMAKEALNEAIGGGDIRIYNDVPYHTQADILDVYDKAINKALAEPTY